MARGCQAGPYHRKRKPATDGKVAGGGLNDLNLPAENNMAIVPSGHVSSLLNQLQDSSGNHDREDGLKKSRRTNPHARSAAAAKEQSRWA